MDLKQLLYFKTIVEEGSISKAANKLYMSQPPLSNQMKALEKEVGCVLFERGPRNIQLTDEGRLLYERANSILDLSENTLEEIKNYSSGAKGTLRIAMVSSVTNSIGLSLLEKYSELYPDVYIELYEHNTYEILESLKNATLQVAIVRTPYPTSSFEELNITSEDIVIYGKSDLLSEEVSLKDLANKPLLTYRRWEDVLINEFEHKKVTPYFKIIADTATTVCSLAENNLGLAIVPSSSINEVGKGMKVAKLKENITSDINLLWNKNGYMPKAGELFVKFVEEEIRLNNFN